MVDLTMSVSCACHYQETWSSAQQRLNKVFYAAEPLPAEDRIPADIRTALDEIAASLTYERSDHSLEYSATLIRLRRLIDQLAFQLRSDTTA